MLAQNRIIMWRPWKIETTPEGFATHSLITPALKAVDSAISHNMDI